MEDHLSSDRDIRLHGKEIGCSGYCGKKIGGDDSHNEVWVIFQPLRDKALVRCPNRMNNYTHIVDDCKDIVLQNLLEEDRLLFRPPSFA